MMQPAPQIAVLAKTVPDRGAAPLMFEPVMPDQKQHQRLSLFQRKAANTKKLESPSGPLSVPRHLSPLVVHLYNKLWKEG